MGDTLNPGDSLRVNESIMSSNGRYHFVYQNDGNLVLYKSYRFQPDWRALWQSGIAGRPAGVCVMQSDDGNLVIYDPGWNPLWDSNTHGNPGSKLVVQNDGNVVIYKPNWTAIWQTNTAQPPIPPTEPVAQGDDMQPGEVLNPSQYIISANGRYHFVYQNDGNLVLYKSYRFQPDWRVLWQSRTAGRSIEVCVMQSDGNLVIFDPDGRSHWTSSTDQNPGSRLVVQDDGNVVIYKPDRTPIWHTNTVQLPIPPTEPVAQGDDMQPGEVLNPSQSISSANGQYTLIYQDDANLVLYRNQDRRYLWASNTWDKPKEVCVMQHDGNLVIFDPDGVPVWTSDTSQHPDSRLKVEDHGNVEIYDPANGRIWETETGSNTIKLVGHVSTKRLGVAISAGVQVTLKQDGTVRFQGYASGGGMLPTDIIEFTISTVIRTPDNNISIAMKHSDSLGVYVGQTAEWNESYRNPLIAAHFDQIQNCFIELAESDKGSTLEVVTRIFTDILEATLRLTIDCIGPGVGLIIFLGVELGSLVMTGSLVPGARIASGILWLAGPAGTVYAIIAEGIAWLGSRTRELSQAEYDFAEQVFAGSLPPRDNLILTDTLGGGDRAFTFPRFDGKITLNMGPSGFDDPLSLPPHGIRGAVFIHELVHAWQIYHTSTDIEWLADAMATTICQVSGGNPYEYGPPGPPFGDFNIEQQAQIVQDWFAQGMDPLSPYFQYIERNIRRGVM